MTSAPTLETERLVMRMFREDDFETYAHMCADPLVMRYLAEGKTLSRMDAWRSLAAFIGHWTLRGYGMWGVEEKSTGQFIGRVGFFNPADWPGLELGWTFAREAWGNGFATEGARRALEYGFTEMNLDHVISLIYPDNAPSIRVAERIGETVEGKAVIFGKEDLVYGITRERWMELRS